MPAPSQTPAAEPAYKPAPLRAGALDVQVTPGMRQLAAVDREQFVQRRRSLLARFGLRAPRRWTRVRRFVVGGAVFLPLVNLLVTSMHFRGYALQVAVGALYGLVLGLWRLPPVLCGLATIAAGGLTVALATGGNLFSPRLGCLLAMILYYLVGHAVGTGDDLTRDEAD